MPKNCQVSTKTYSVEFNRLESDLILMRRVIDRMDLCIDTEVYPYWSFVIVNDVRGQLSMARPGFKVDLRRETAIFVPPFQVIEWHVGPGTVDFTVFISKALLPGHFSPSPLAFPYVDKILPESLSEIIAVLQRAQQPIPVGRAKTPTALARKIKEILDESFRRQKSLTNIARENNIHPSVLARYFKDSFGLSPTKYRKLLRLFDAQRQLLIDQNSVAETATDVGFNDVSKFNRHFKNLMLATPSQFRLK